MNKKTLLLGLAVLTSLVGCASQVPMSSTYAYSDQQKMQAAHHWDVLAADVAVRLKAHFRSASLSDQAFNVVPNSNSPFEQGFEDLLITQLVDKGLDIRDNKYQSLKLKFHTQVISHNDRGYIRPKVGEYSTLAVLATGVWGVINNTVADALITSSVIATGVVADVFSGSISERSNTEVIINVSLMDGDRYLMRKSGIYYINAPDNSHYEVTSKPISVVSD